MTGTFSSCRRSAYESVSSPPIGDQRVDPERLDDAQHVLGEVERPVPVRLAREELGHLVGADVSRVRPRRVEHRPARPVDRADIGQLESADVAREGRLVVGIALEQACPPAPHAQDLVARVLDPRHEGLDARVQAGDVPAPGEHCEAHRSSLSRPRAGRFACRGYDHAARRSGGTGRRAGLKIPCPSGRVGSTPTSGMAHSAHRSP